MNFDLEFHEGILLYKLLSDSRREVVLKTDAGGLQFSLQQDAQMQQGQHNSTPDMRAPSRGGQAEAEIITEIATGNAALAAQLRGGVDIRI